MYRTATLTLGALAVATIVHAPAHAQQQSEPSYKADPGVYKVIFEDKNFRVIEATRKAGQHDKPHAHPLPSVVYFLTDCNDDLFDSTGKKVRNSARKAGEAVAAPIVKSHSTQNVGSTDCRQLFVERK